MGERLREGIECILDWELWRLRRGGDRNWGWRGRGLGAFVGYSLDDLMRISVSVRYISEVGIACDERTNSSEPKSSLPVSVRLIGVIPTSHFPLLGTQSQPSAREMIWCPKQIPIVQENFR